MSQGERVAICPGTFDPITNGHLDVIERAAALFDRVIVAVAGDSGKSTFFSLEERTELARASLSHLGNVEVESFDGLLVEYARERGASAIVKGVRTGEDFGREQQMAMINREMLPQTDTTLLVTSPEVMYVSSALIRWISQLGGDVSRFVPEPVAQALARKRR
jgi:pantetheine-phosphate adenylyltransferase